MAAASSEASVSSMSTSSTKSAFANYDVLLCLDDETGQLALDSTQHHVGNHRFKVLLDMQRTDFENNHRQGGDNSKIIQKMMSIVTRECVPAGRFLQPPQAKIGGIGKDEEVEELDNDDATLRWHPVPDEEVVKFIERSLMPKQESSEFDKPPLPLNIKPIGKTGAADGGTNRRVSFRDSSLEPIPFEDPSLAEAAPAHHQVLPPFPPPPPPSFSSAAADEEKKRRRRSSLLSRSISEQISSVVRDLDVKKKMNRTTEERRPSLWRLFGKNKMVSKPEPLDVLITCDAGLSGGTGSTAITDRADLVPNHTGNNRLQVMMQMEREKYASASIDEQAKMLKHWIETVVNFWKGRFLLQKHEQDPLLDEVVMSYLILDAGQAEKALEQVMHKLVERAADPGNSFNSPLGTLFEGGSIESFQPSGEFSNADLEPSSEFSQPRPIQRATMQRASSESAALSGDGRRRNRFALPNLARNFSERVSSKSNSSVSSGGGSSRNAGMRRTSSASSSSTTLPDPPPGLPENMQGMRNAAVESLQRRKKRQGLASRIQKMAETTLRRSSSVASGVGTSDGGSASGSQSGSLLGRFGSFRRSSANSENTGPMPTADIPTTLNAPVAAAARRPSHMSASSGGTNNTRGSVFGRWPGGVPKQVNGGAQRRTSHMSMSSVSTMGDGSSRNLTPNDTLISEEIIFFNGDANGNNIGDISSNTLDTKSLEFGLQPPSQSSANQHQKQAALKRDPSS